MKFCQNIPTLHDLIITDGNHASTDVYFDEGYVDNRCANSTFRTLISMCSWNESIISTLIDMKFNCDNELMDFLWLGLSEKWSSPRSTGLTETLYTP